MFNRRIIVLAVPALLVVLLSIMPAKALYEGDTAFLWGSGSDSRKGSSRNTDDMVRQGDLYYDDIARYLAGMPQISSNELKKLEASQGWTAHAAYFNNLYTTLEQKRLPAIRKFTESELKDVNENTETLLYMFSGPDFFYADLFFPKATTMVLFGLERAGHVPALADLDPVRQQSFFNVLRSSLVWMYDWGYFVTTFMDESFNKDMELRGVTPLIMFFMARAECTVLDVQRITVNAQGQVVSAKGNPADVDTPWDAFPSGVKITYRKKDDSIVRTLFYWSQDISDTGLVKTPHFRVYLDNLKFQSAFFKAASYLPTWLNYCRNTVLGRAQYVFQTDSGIPVRYFGASQWTVQLYGMYMGILQVFPAFAYQQDLRQRYLTDTTRKPLEFGIGYGFRLNPAGSNMQIMRRKIDHRP